MGLHRSNAKGETTCSSGTPRQFGVEIRAEYGLQLLEELAALARLAAIEVGDHRGCDIRPCREHPAAVVLRQPWKRFGKDAIEVTGERAAQLPRQAIESRVRLAAGKHAHESRRLGLDAGDPIDEPRDESPAVLHGGAYVEPLARGLPLDYLDRQVVPAIAKKQQLTKKLFDAGAQLYLGTDVAQPFLLPGASLLEEMALFVDAGIGIEQVWKLATRGAGDRLGVRGLGRVETDAPADISVFRRDPTKAIGNISSLEAVVAAGKLYRIADLHRALQSNQAYFTSPLIRPLARRGAERALARALGRSRG